MKRLFRDSRGFTLIELVIVAGILSVVTGAVFSIYLTHMKTAYSQDELIEVQQNLRIAMDAITSDLQMAGALVPLTAFPVQNGFANYSTSLQINTGSPEGRFARINKATPQFPGGFSNFTTSVASSFSAAGFAVGDRVRIIRPYDNSAPFANYTAFIVANPVSSNPLSVSLTAASTLPAGVSVNPGDMIAKINTPAVGYYPAHAYNTIVYRIVTGGNCPVGSCLARQVSPASPLPAPAANEIVASNLSHMSLSYLLDSASETQNPSGSESSIKAVRVVLTGVTTKKTSSDWHARTRQLSTLVKLRNRRIF